MKRSDVLGHSTGLYIVFEASTANECLNRDQQKDLFSAFCYVDFITGTIETKQQKTPCGEDIGDIGGLDFDIKGMYY